MAMTIKDIREKYPDYNDLSDTELADKLHSKFYSDLPKKDVYSKLGLSEENEESEAPKESKPMELTLTKGKDKKSADWRGLASDAVNMLGRALKGGVEFAGRAPGNIKEIGSELINHPLSTPPHIAQQALAGLGEGIKGLANIPHELFDEFSNRNITPDWLRTGSIPEDTGVEKFLGLEPTKKSDELLRALPALLGGGQLVAKGISKAKNALAAPSKETLFQRAMEERIGKAAEKVGMSESELNDLQNQLKRDYSKIHGEKLGAANPTALQEGINIAEHKIAENKPLTEIPEKKIGEIPEPPDTKMMISKLQDAVDAAHQAAETKLGIKENPHISARGKIKKAINEVKSSAENLYKQGRDYYVDKQVKVDNSKDIKALGKELEELSANEDIFEGTQSERDAINQQIKSLEGKTIDATNLFDLQRTLETVAENTRKKQYSGNVPQLEFKRLGNIAQRLDDRAAQLAKRLESVGGKDVQKIMTEANKGWRTYKQLSKENPVGKAALSKSRTIPNDALIKIADNYPANDFLKALVDSDPELKKNLLAIYAGENNVKRLIKPSTAVNNALQSLPEVEEHVQALKNAISEFKTGKSNTAKIKEEHKELSDSIKKAAEEQEVRRNAIEESAKLEEQIKFRKAAIPKIEEKMKNKDVNSAEHKKLQKELDDHRKFIKDKGGRLKELAHFFVKVKVAGKIHL